MLKSWMLWSSNLFLTTAALRTGGLSFCRCLKDRLCVRGTGSLPLALGEQRILYLLFILCWSTCFIFSPSLPGSAVGQNFY
jgi:hypothetical protein